MPTRRPRLDPAGQAQANADIAATAAEGVTETVNLFAGDESTLDGFSAPSPSAAALSISPALWSFADRCAYDLSLGRFVCPSVMRGPLTIERSFGLANALGQPMDHFDPIVTASANFLMTVAGSVERDGWTGSVRRQRSVTVSGLAGQETAREWNGTGSDTVHSTHVNGDVTRTYDAAHEVAVSHVVVNLPRSDNPWPASGTITISVAARQTIEGDTDRTRAFSRTVIVTFNGTQFVDLQVGDRHFTLDLATGHVTAAA